MVDDKKIDELTDAINNLAEKIDGRPYLSYDELSELVSKIEAEIDSLVIAIGYLCQSMPYETESEESP